LCFCGKGEQEKGEKEKFFGIHNKRENIVLILIKANVFVVEETQNNYSENTLK